MTRYVYRLKFIAKEIDLRRWVLKNVINIIFITAYVYRILGDTSPLYIYQ